MNNDEQIVGEEVEEDDAMMQAVEAREVENQREEIRIIPIDWNESEGKPDVFLIA